VINTAGTGKVIVAGIDCRLGRTEFLTDALDPYPRWCRVLHSPARAAEPSPGRKPWDNGRRYYPKPRRGARRSGPLLSPLPGLIRRGLFHPRLAPWAKLLRPSGASSYTATMILY